MYNHSHMVLFKSIAILVDAVSYCLMCIMFQPMFYSLMVAQGYNPNNVKGRL